MKIKGIERYDCASGGICGYDQATRIECSTCEAGRIVFTKEKQKQIDERVKEKNDSLKIAYLNNNTKEIEFLEEEIASIYKGDF